MSLEPDSVKLEGSLARGRFVYALPDGSEAEVRFYEQPSGTAIVHHTETPPQHRGRGIAADLVAHAVGELAAAGRTIVPLCPFVAGEFRRHPEWARLLRPA